MMTKNEGGAETIPPDLGDAFQSGLGLAEPPETIEELTDRIQTRLEGSGTCTSLDVLCTADRSRHRARIDGETMHFHCVLDALIAPFMVDSSDGVRVESATPDATGTVTMEIDDDFTVSPADSVVSLGMAPGASAPTEGPLNPQLVYGHFCPYVNAFPNEAAYREWAADIDVPKMAIPAQDAYEFGRVLGTSF